MGPGSCSRPISKYQVVTRAVLSKRHDSSSPSSFALGFIFIFRPRRSTHGRRRVGGLGGRRRAVCCGTVREGHHGGGARWRREDELNGQLNGPQNSSADLRRADSSTGSFIGSIIGVFHWSPMTEPDLKSNSRVDDFEQTTMRTRACLLYTSPSPRDRTRSRMPSSA